MSRSAHGRVRDLRLETQRARRAAAGTRRAEDAGRTAALVHELDAITRTPVPCSEKRRPAFDRQLLHAATRAVYGNTGSVVVSGQSLVSFRRGVAALAAGEQLPFEPGDLVLDAALRTAALALHDVAEAGYARPALDRARTDLATCARVYASLDALAPRRTRGRA